MTKEMAITILRGDVLGTDEQTHEAVFMAIKALKEQERVDAVEVLRCKDCKHNSLNRIIGNTYCNLGIGLSQLYDYCSHGERRKDETC